MSTTTTPTSDAPAPAEAPPQTQALEKTGAAAPKPSFEFDPDDPVALYMDTGVFEQLQRVASMMSKAGVVPAHLRGPDHVADCFLVVAQAFRWRMDPFAVAQHTFVVSGKLGYEGKLVAGLINTHKALDQGHRLDYEYSGEGSGRTVRVFARLRGEPKDREIKGKVSDWATDNPKWKTMTDQMLAYRGAREWARRHLPEALLGIDSVDESTVVDLERGRDGAFAPPAPGTPVLDALADRLEAAATPPAAAAAETAPAPEPGPLSADHPDAEKEPPTIVHGSLRPAVEPQADPNTQAGNPFLRGERKAREAAKQRTLTEQ